MEILRASDYSSGLYRADAISVPSGSNACLLTIPRDGWSDRLGDGTAEEIGFQDPDDSRRIVTLRANRDEVVRAWVMASLDKGSTWFFAGMVGTRGGPLPQRIVGGTLKEPILGPGVETAIRICGIEGALLRIFFECLTNVRAKLDIAFLSVDSPELTPRHNSVGFVAANSNVATSASSVSSGNITPSGDNRMVIAYSTEVTITGVGTHTLTYAGGSGTSILDYTDSGFGGVVRLRADRFMSPATSANQASVTRSGGNAHVLSCGVAAFDGVDQTTPVGTPVVTETTAASISVNVPDVEADDMVNDLVVAGSTPIAPNQSNTSRWEEEPAGFDSSGSSTKTGTGTVTIGWSIPGDGAAMAGWRIIAAGTSELAVGSASHGHTATSPTLVQSFVLSVASSAHGHAAESVDLTQVSTLAPADASHAHEADAVELTQAHLLAAASAAHAQTAGVPVLVQSHILDAADAAHEQAAEEVELTQAHVLALADAAHGHAADNVVLSQAHLLVVQDASHDHAADNIVLTVAGVLDVAGAAHAHTADSVALTQAHVLAVADAAHGHAADSVTLSLGLLLTVADALHSHAVDNVALTQAHVLTVAEALHGHSAANVVLEQAQTLSVDRASHGHAAESPTLSLADILSVADAVHEHTADEIELTQQHVLIVSSALHQHLAEVIGLRLPGHVPPPKRVFIVTTPRRTYIVSGRGRQLQ